MRCSPIVSVDIPSTLYKVGMGIVNSTLDMYIELSLANNSWLTLPPINVALYCVGKFLPEIPTAGPLV